MSMLGYPSWLVVVSLIAGMLGTGGVGYMLKTLLEHKRGVRQQTDDISLSMVQQTNNRLDAVEKAASADRRLATQERALCSAELRHAHHCINNQAGTLSAMFMLLEVAPDKTTDIVRMGREKVQQDAQIEAVERAAIVHLRAQFGVLPEDGAAPPEAAGDDEELAA